MDFFGISAGALGALRVYFRSARGTGRTTRLLIAVKDGDRVCFSDSKMAHHFKRLCQEVGKDIECRVVPVNAPESILQAPRSKGRTFFDHALLEELYVRAIDRTAQSISQLEQMTSALPEPPDLPPFVKGEISKWQ